MMESGRLTRIKQLLEENHTWPCQYLFKFIVPESKISQILAIIGEEGEVKTRPSKKGNYISVSLKLFCESPNDVVLFYERVSVVEGIVAL